MPLIAAAEVPTALITAGELRRLDRAGYPDCRVRFHPVTLSDTQRRSHDWLISRRSPSGQRMNDAEKDAEIEDFLEGFNQPTYRGMRINGVRVATWSSQHGWSDDSRPDANWLL